MIDNPVIFYSASFMIIGFALASLLARNVIYSLLASVCVFFLGALFFYVLGSEYNAIIQAAIYGLAVPVILGISIMFRGRFGKSLNSKPEKYRKYAVPYILLMCMGIFVLAFIYLVMISLVMMPDTFNFTGVPNISAYDNILAFARGIFINYVWAFELVSLLLTIVIAGLSMFRRRGGRGKNAG